MIPAPFGFIGRNSGFNPAAYGTLALWFKADALGLEDEDVVDTWPDLSGNGNDATQGTFSKMLLYSASAIGGKPSVRYDGVDDWLTSSCPSASRPFTFFAVVRMSDLADYRTIIGSSGTGLQVRVAQTSGLIQLLAQSAAGIANSTAGISAGVAHIVAVTYDVSGAYAFYIDGAPVGAGVSNQSFGTSTTSLGANGGSGEFMAGDQSEILKFASLLDADGIAAVHAYLAAKYSIPVS